MLRLSGYSLALMLLTVVPAHAYVDPGAAMLVIQGIVGAIAAAGLFFRRSIASMFGFLRPSKQEKTTQKKSEDETQ